MTNLNDNIKKRRKEIARRVRQQSGETDSSENNHSEVEKSFAKLYKNQKLWIGLGVATVLILVAVVSCMPRTGTIRYGICKVYIEKNIAIFPGTILEILSYESGYNARIEYMNINLGGNKTYEVVECKFRQSPTQGLVLSEVIHERDKRPDAEIEKFNKIIPVIIANPPDLTMPPWPNYDLKKLWRG